MNLFFITGLPRSRTAWLANYLSYGDTVCLHDVLKDAISECDPEPLVDAVERAVQWARDCCAKSFGICDPALLLCLPQLWQKYPDAKWVVMKRDLEAVKASCRRLGINPPVLLDVLECKKQGALQALAGQTRFTSIQFAELDNSLDYLTSFVGAELSPQWRKEMLCRMNVQVNVDAALAEIKERTGTDLREAAQEPLTAANREYLATIQAMCGNETHAFRWFTQVLEAALVWDHIVDGDGLDTAMAERVFEALTMDWGINPWYQRNAFLLTPVVSNAADAWRWSNTSDGEKARAYDVYTEVPATMALILGGAAAVRQWMPKIRELARRILAEDEERDGGRK